MTDSSSVEEQLFAALSTGVAFGLREHKLLSSDGIDLEAKNKAKDTLLHAAVRQGRADWVENLLSKGADPEAVDGRGITVWKTAEEWALASTVDRPSSVACDDRVAILRLVRVARDREAAKSCEDSAAKRLGESLPELPSQVAPSTDGANESVRLLREILEKMQPVVAMAEGLKELKEGVKELKEYTMEILQVVRGGVAESSREKCIEEMMRKTTILDTTEDKVSQVRRLYEMLYSLDPATNCLLRFLEPRTDVKIMLDCDSYFIDTLKKGLVDADGLKVPEYEERSVVDFEAKTLYAGVSADEVLVEKMALSWLARGLTQLCIGLAFGNEGRPYAPGDVANGEKIRGILRELEERKGRRVPGLPLEDVDYFEDFLLREGRTQRAKEADLIAAVPIMLAQFGAERGRTTLNGRMPGLMEYYTQHAMAALRNITAA